MEDSHEILQKARTLLAIAQGETEERLKNPKINQWGDINLEKYEKIIHHINIHDDLLIAQIKFHEQADIIFNHISTWKNEIGYLETDIKHKQISPNNAAKKAIAIEKGSCKLEKALGKFRLFTDNLLEADEHLRGMLNFQSMMKFAKKFTGEKEKIFNEGFMVYCLLGEETPNQGDSTAKLTDLFSMAVAIENKLKNIDLSFLPAMSADIISFRLTSSRAVTKQIKQFIERTTNLLARDQLAIQELKKKLVAMQDLPANKILKELGPTAQSLRKIMVRLQTNHFALEKIKLTQELFKQLNLFHATIKNNLLGTLTNLIEDDQSPLNPLNTAQKHASEYFTGLQGVIRMLKLLLTKQKGVSRLNEEELTNKFTEAINSCSLYFSHNESDILKMENFINGYIHNYPSPFPREGLFKAMRMTLGDYGSTMEEYFDTFSLKYSEIDGVGRRKDTISLKKLLTTMVASKEDLKELD